LDVTGKLEKIYSRGSIFHPAVSENGMVSTQERLATEAGVGVLREGGNAVDAAVTVALTLAVTLPNAGNLGGGGFMVMRLDEEVIVIDYRERAPLAADEGLFLGEDGKVDEMKPSRSFLSIGVPGTPAGLALALEKYGTISLKRAMEPAIRHAENGFPIYPRLAASIVTAKELMQRSPASMKVFFKEGGAPRMVGETLVQKDLARSLRELTVEGLDHFYSGEIGRTIVEYVQENGGIFTNDDLERYEPTMREPVCGTYRGHEVYTMPPPSSGGVHLMQMLNILEGYPVGDMGHNTAEYIHLMSEVMKLAYHDRFMYLGDTDFVDVPVEGLTSKEYAEELRVQVNLERSSPSSENVLADPFGFESEETTHFSVMDGEGNMVANTYTLALGFGSKFMAPGTGILLNNEMGDFTAQVGYVDGSGMSGGVHNTIAPLKRPLSSMTPTIVTKGGEPFMVTGSVGGGRIITGTLQVMMNVIDHGMNVAEAVSIPRFHHQWMPDELRLEKGFSEDTVRLLKARGHSVVERGAMGSSQSITFEEGVYFGASDPRTPSGSAKGF
jgi:gamma-glutamyltranspeptidase/glutathione hydrolase